MVAPRLKQYARTNAASAQQTSGSTVAPPTAAAAPKVSTQIGTGLMAELNRFQGDLLKNIDSQGRARPLVEYADVYNIVFADDMIANAKIVPPAGLDKGLAVGSTGGTAADSLDPNRQSMDPTVRARSCRVGQQIVQFIDQVIRSSTYIQDQSIQVWNQDTGQFDYRPTNSKQFVWYQVICNVEQREYDNLRNDFAYRITYTIVPYEVPMLSNYFPSGQYRGVHKDYQYWWTGQNNSVLSFEQSYNAQWTQAITGTNPPDTRTLKINDQQSDFFALRWKTNVFPASAESNQGGEQYVMEPGANAADFLYTADLATAKITIVGDPAWLPSPLSQIVTQDSFTVDPFLADGTVNSIASGAYFRIRYRAPADYNLDTGLVDFGDTLSTTQGNNGTNVVSTIYKLQHATHTFKGGKFTQELSGSWVTYDAAAEQVQRENQKKNQGDTKAAESRDPPSVIRVDPANSSAVSTNQSLGPGETVVNNGAPNANDARFNPLIKQETFPASPAISANSSDAQIRLTLAYKTAIAEGKNDATALAEARAKLTQGPATNTAPQQIRKDGNPG